MKAYLVALLALLAVNQLAHPVWAQDEDDYGGDGEDDEGYGEGDEDDYGGDEGYGDDEDGEGGGEPPAELKELTNTEEV